MKEVFLSVATVAAIFLFAPARVSPSAIGSGHLVVIILAQSVEQEINQEIEQELPSDQGPHKKRWDLARTHIKTQTQPRVIVLVPQIVPVGTKLRTR